MNEQPAQAEIIIIGGGAVGCSIAYHLGLLGRRDVVLLEKAGLTQGATWHAAGLVGQLRGKRNLTRLMQYSASLYADLERRTGQDPGWHAVGSLRVASSRRRWQEILRTASTARAFGFELDLLDAEQARERFPLMGTDDVVGAAWIPSDGYIDPSSLTQAYARGARSEGVRIIEGERVVQFLREGRRITGVVTDRRIWRCETVVNAAGLWARDVARLAGVEVAAGVVEHQYLVTEKSDQVMPGLPTFRDPDKLFYLKPEAGSLAVGGWEADTPAYAAGGMPADFAQQLLPGNFDRFEQIAALTTERLPIMAELGIRTLINGPIPVSADGEPIMGPAPELDNFYLACGFTAGIAGSGGAGKTIAEWIDTGEPEYDIFGLDSRRFGSVHAAPDVLRARSIESYGRYYAIHWPVEEVKSARNLRTSPLFQPLREAGAVYGAKFGWERANWFAAAPGETDTHDFDRAKTNWFTTVGEEHRAVRERAGIIDQSSFAKLVIRGPDALAALQWLCVTNMDRPVGSVIYTQMCNPRGGIECDLTVMRTGESAFYVVTGSGFGVHDFDWIRRVLREFERVEHHEVTGQYAVINVCGPASRDILAAVTDADVGNQALPFARFARIHIGAARVKAARIGYVGELGYELHLPVEYAATVYRRLWAAGKAHALTNVGYRAIDSLRMEKGYLYWSADITPDYSPLECGLGGRIAFKSKDQFCGREALAAQREQGVRRALRVFTADGPPVFYGGEPVLVNGEVVGVTTSANFGYTLGTNIAYAYLAVEIGDEDGFELEAFGERYPARSHAQALYDPSMQRLKG